MTRTIMTILAVALCLALAPPARADEPAQAVKGFFQAVVGGDYARAWNLLSSRSQDRIVAAIAQDERLDPNAVRQLFETNDPAIREGFWAGFRSTSRSEVLADKTFTTLSVAGNQATVRLVGHEGNFLAVQERGAWRFGLIETFPPSR